MERTDRVEVGAQDHARLSVQCEDVKAVGRHLLPLRIQSRLRQHLAHHTGHGGLVSGYRVDVDEGSRSFEERVHEAWSLRSEGQRKSRPLVFEGRPGV